LGFHGLIPVAANGKSAQYAERSFSSNRPPDAACEMAQLIDQRLIHGDFLDASV
jgi:hypothetical protein